MYKPALLLAFLLLFGLHVGAQTDSLAPKTLLRKLELGIDGVPYIAGEAGVSVLFKARFRGPYFKGARHRQTALRSHAKFTTYHDGFSYLVPNAVVPDTLFFRSFSGPYQHFGLSVGIEQQFVRRRLGTYIGAEAFGFAKWVDGVYRVDADPVGPEPPINTAVFDGSFSEKAFGLAGLAGIRYFILRSLSIGLEAHFSAALNFTEVQNFENGVILYDNSRVLDFRLQPIRVLYLSYHFGR
ncbi:MAG TPA: hypothetical protein VK168_11480 [Saprospiraceae bacterium]|nr:hypothetical protein [Saprospiraceae bacterium]